MGETDGLLPKLYDDLLSSSTREIGDTLTRAVKLALSPAKAVLWTFEQATVFAQERVRHILMGRDVRPENVVTPRVEIAAPIINALRIRDQSETLRELYLNLLATAMDASRASSVHPAFVEIIKNLTPDEARAVVVLTWLNAIGSPAYFPLIELVAKLRDGGEVQVVSRFTNIGTLAGCSAELPTSSIDNFVRLGLVVVHLDRKMLDEDEYAPLINHAAIAEMKMIAEGRPGAEVVVRRGVLEGTQLGFDFAHACTGGIECIGLNPTALCEHPRPRRKR